MLLLLVILGLLSRTEASNNQFLFTNPPSPPADMNNPTFYGNPQSQDELDIYYGETENTLKGILYNLVLYGEWYSTAIGNQANYFSGTSGFAMLNGFDSDASDIDSDIDTDSTDLTDDSEASELDFIGSLDTPFYVFLYDGDSMGKNLIQINMNFDNLTYNRTNSSFIGQQVISYSLSGDQTATDITCLADIGFYFINRTNNQPILPQSNVYFYGFAAQLEISSTNCSMSFITTIMTTDSFLDKGMTIYIVLMSLAGAVSFYSAYRMLTNFPNNVEELKSITVWSLWISCSWEFFLAVFHVYAAIHFIRFWILILTVLFFFTISMLRKINQLILIVSRRESRDSLPFNLRILLGLIPMLILCATYCVGVFINNCGWLLLTSSLYMAPQIAKIYVNKERPTTYYWHNFAFALSKLFFVVYYFLYDENLFGTRPKPIIAYTYIGLIVAQVLIILIQRKLPQFLFIMRKIMVKSRRNENPDEACAICLEPLSGTIDPNSSLNSEVEKVVETPCRHKFHRSCIDDWLKVKNTCPLDRNRIDNTDLFF